MTESTICFILGFLSLTVSFFLTSLFFALIGGFLLFVGAIAKVSELEAEQEINILNSEAEDREC